MNPIQDTPEQAAAFVHDGAATLTMGQLPDASEFAGCPPLPECFERQNCIKDEWLCLWVFHGPCGVLYVDPEQIARPLALLNVLLRLSEKRWISKERLAGIARLVMAHKGWG